MTRETQEHSIKEREKPEKEVAQSAKESKSKGAERLHRSWKALLATGFLGGIDISMGILPYLLVLETTGNHLLAGLAFSIAFVALYLAHAELFTENFFYPVVSVFAGEGTWRDLVRLWFFTLVMNFIGGGLAIGLITLGFPELHATLGESAQHFLGIGLSWQGAALAVLAGMMITLMTRMHAGSEHPVAIIAASVAGGLVLAGGSLFHSVLDSVLIFGAIWAGQGDITLLDWLGWVWWVIPLNILGGVLLTTAPRVFRAVDASRMS